MSTAPGLLVAGSASFGGARIFGPLEITAPAGCWTCLLGPSGVGKSTILRLLAGLAEEAEFAGTAGATDGAPLAGRVAFMAQGDMLLPWADVTGNVLLGARLRGEMPERARAARLVARVGLAGQARRRPARLSGGQRQRVALARTLMEDRPVVLLDEPFSALDARTRTEMQDLAAELFAGRTVLLVTHDPAEAARLGHHVLVMTESGVARLAPPEAPPPRAVDAEATLTFQARLMRRLMARA